MKLLNILIASFISFGPLFSQTIDDDGYIEIPALTDQIKVHGDAITYEDATIKLFKHDPYPGSIVAGSWMRFEISGIEDVHIFDGYSFMLTRMIITNTDTKEMLLETPWSTDDDDETLIKSNGSTKTYHKGKLKTNDVAPGNYEWKMEFGNLCEQTKTSFSLKFKIIQNPTITTVSNKLSCDLAYILNKEHKYYITSDSLATGKHAFVMKNLKGFVSEDNVVKIGMSVKLTDEDTKEVIINKDDLFVGADAFNETDEDGTINPNYTIDIGSRDKGKNCVLTIKVWDKHKPENAITSEYKFRIIK